METTARVAERDRQPAPFRPGCTLSGVVLAAGRSTRMGRDKALLEAPEGGALWERQRDVLTAAGAGTVYLSARPEQLWARDAKGVAAVLHDALPGCGPLVGITAALERAIDASHVAALAVDLPRMPAAWLGELTALCEPGIGAVGRRAGFFEPLAAIYSRETMWLAWEALARGDYSLQRFLAQAVERGTMRAREISDAEADWFNNWNEGPEGPAEPGQVKLKGES